MGPLAEMGEPFSNIHTYCTVDNLFVNPQVPHYLWNLESGMEVKDIKQILVWVGQSVL